MIRRILFALVIAAFSYYPVKCQVNTSFTKAAGSRIQNNVLGISFAKVGASVQSDSSTYTVALLPDASSGGSSASAVVSASKRLFVDLPGSYGGKLFLDSAPASALVKDIIMTDSVSTGTHTFRRDYWAVYAGMGMWDCVVNCYFKADGNYYIVSLVRNSRIGKPGEIINGSPLKSGDLKLKALASLRDSSDVAVGRFDELLNSFQVQK